MLGHGRSNDQVPALLDHPRPRRGHPHPGPHVGPGPGHPAGDRGRGSSSAGAVLAAVHHAEVVAHRVGEPFGSLVLAVAVTVIEVALIVTLMVSGGKDTAVAGPRHRLRRRDDHLQRHRRALACCVGAHAVPAHARSTPRAPARRWPRSTTLADADAWCCRRFTTSEPGPEFSAAQLAFAAVASLVLYGMFVLTQTVRHRDFFLPVTERRATLAARTTTTPTRRPTGEALTSLGLLLRRRWSPSSAWPRSSRRRSRRASPRPASRRRSSASSSRCWCCCPRRSPRSAPPAATGSRSASTSRSARRWPASA